MLVVDDQPENRQLLVKLLEQVGLWVKSAYNGHDAIDKWLAWQPDLILMDIRMPGFDGYDATRQIRRLEDPAARTVIIAVTAQVSNRDRALSLAAGCDDYIIKPFQEATLFLKMAEQLGLEYVFAQPNLPNLPNPAAIAQPPCADEYKPTALAPEDLRHLPATWLQDLDDAAICGTDLAIHTLVRQLPTNLAGLAQRLNHLADHYQFERIVQMFQVLSNS